jgi:hypothetical protein
MSDEEENDDDDDEDVPSWASEPVKKNPSKEEGEFLNFGILDPGTAPTVGTRRFGGRSIYTPMAAVLSPEH